MGRWQRFYQWEAALADMAADNEALASAYEASAAADNNIAKIAAAQTSTFDFSYYNEAVKGFTLDGKSYEQLNFKLNRTNIVTYRVFTVHSFTNQKDYYFVQCNVSTTPKNYKDTTVHIDTGEGDGFTINFLYGYTRRVAIEHYIDSGTMSVSDVALLDNEPKNINKDTTYKAGVEKELSGKIGVNKDGVTAEIGGSLKYSNETSWTTKEYEVRNECENLYRASAAWYVNMTLPYDSGKYVDSHFLFLNYAVHWGIKFYDASIRQLEFPCEWIWEVGKDYWKNHATINLNGKFTIHDGLSIGRTDNGETVYNRADHYRERTGKISMTLNQPPHVAATKRLFPVTSKGATANYFSLLSEDDWTITDIPSWIHLAQSSGNATGGAETLVLFDVDANTTNAPRKGTFTVKSGRDTLTIEVAQSGN